MKTPEDHVQMSDVAALKMPDAHGSHDRHSVAMFRDKFWLSFALTIPVVFWSTDVQHWLYRAPSFPGSKFIPAILGTVVFVYGGLVFIRGAWGELADHEPGMMTLISLAIIVAFGTSLAAAFGLFEIDLWWELASLITIMVLGHWLEMQAISQARGALNALAALLPDTAERITGAARLLSSEPWSSNSNQVYSVEGADALIQSDDLKAAVAFVELMRRVPQKWGAIRCPSLDAPLKVYGIENLRIADGSIMPRVTTGNTMAPCIIIGEHAAEALRNEHRLETSSVSRSARI